MRFLILFAVIGAVGWWAWRTAHNGFQASTIEGVMSKFNGTVQSGLGSGPATNKALAAAGVDPAAAPASAPMAGAVATRAGSPAGRGGAVAADVPRGSRTFYFQHREPPAAVDLSASVTATGVSVLVDALTRSVCVIGTLEGVDTVYRYLETIDKVAGSCSVRTWAVYVDRSQVSGWDLSAAIRSVAAGGESSLTVGNGGLVLDLSAGQIAAALDIIGDGSTVEVIHRPHVQLMHGAAALIESLQEIPVPNTTLSQGMSQSSVTYRKVGLQLEVIPYFFGNDRVRLTVKQSNGMLGQNVKIDGNEIPIIQSQAVSTSCEMAVGQAVVLGGVSTLRKEKIKGLLRDREEVAEGMLYVVLSTYFDAPRAVVVSSAMSVDPPSVDAVPLLPPLGWEREPVGAIAPVADKLRKVFVRPRR